VNGVDISFKNCDKTPNSQLTLFADFAEIVPKAYNFDGKWVFCKKLFSSLEVNPSHRAVPVDYFTFMELHFGGCGCFSQTDGRSSIEGTVSAAIGFR